MLKTWLVSCYASRFLPDRDSQAHQVEELLKDLLGEAKGGGRQAGEQECACLFYLRLALVYAARQTRQ